ncbi:MAG: hypothetical protein LBD32_02710, partial [Cytophagales bacterium]|nr:hypothetical protein [Cytophagales bacterium]
AFPKVWGSSDKEKIVRELSNTNFYGLVKPFAPAENSELFWDLMVKRGLASLYRWKREKRF